ncbi:MAG: cytochrome c-type biogenesis protein CcmH [Caldilineaceae bacterium]
MERFRLKEQIITLLLLTVLLLVTSVTVAAQSQPVTHTVSADDVNVVARELWCPLCSGVRLDACELQACEQMREEIGLKLGAGEDINSIKQDFVARYGEQVLGAPPRQGWGWLAWLLPPIVMLSAGAFLFMRGREWLKPTVAINPMTQKKTEADNQADKQKVAPVDPYEKQLDEELNRYE